MFALPCWLLCVRKTSIRKCVWHRFLYQFHLKNWKIKIVFFCKEFEFFIPTTSKYPVWLFIGSYKIKMVCGCYSLRICSGILTQFASDSSVNLNNDFDCLDYQPDNQNHCSNSLANRVRIPLVICFESISININTVFIWHM